jgi:hypothetical protein
MPSWNGINSEQFHQRGGHHILRDRLVLESLGLFRENVGKWVLSSGMMFITGCCSASSSAQPLSRSSSLNLSLYFDCGLRPLGPS